jgi:hypothetical protein
LNPSNQSLSKSSHAVTVAVMHMTARTVPHVNANIARHNLRAAMRKRTPNASSAANEDAFSNLKTFGPPR